jgi:hypothetical protein
MVIGPRRNARCGVFECIRVLLLASPNDKFPISVLNFQFTLQPCGLAR